jgi:hypothetical protein
VHDIGGDTARETQPTSRILRAGPLCCAKFVTHLSEHGIHRTSGGVAHVREHVRVDVEGKAYVRVAQKLLDVLGVDALP